MMKNTPVKKTLYLLLLFLCWCMCVSASNPGFRVVGYFRGTAADLDSFETEKLTHLIFCFGNLQGNQFQIHSAVDSALIKKMVQLKTKNPAMKVLLSLGGWNGCPTCSDVFNTETGRKEFAQSIKELTHYFKTDGIDLDWEYPAIEGPPGHTFRKADRKNFTELLKEIRNASGASFEISFAAGGFTTCIDSSFEWNEIINYADFINIMTYDLVHGYSTMSGHHTPLYSTTQQKESTDNAVQLLLKKGVPANKIVIGAAFYGRYFQIEEGSKVDLYMPCKFLNFFDFRNSSNSLSAKNGFEKHWDDVAKAPYAINTKRRLLATYDDEKSIALKTKYAVENKLGGIMFWQLNDDKFRNGLLDIINKNK